MNVGIVVGKFYPSHIGHVNLIQTATSMYDKVIVIVSHSDSQSEKLYEDSNLKRPLTAKDKLAIVQKTFQFQKELIIPILVDESNIAEYPHGWPQWAYKVRKEILNNRRVRSEIYDYKGEEDGSWPRFKEVANPIFVVNEGADISGYEEFFNCDTRTLDTEREEYPISATMVRNDPYKYWDFIPRASREYLVPTIVIAGGESSGKSIMTNKLANVYATTSVQEYGRNIINLELGGDESALQSKHYRDIVNGHYQDLKFARINANKVVFSDTDFVATQAFHMTYEGSRSNIVQEYIESTPFDLVILLDNSTKWVDDGMRMIGEEEERKKFQDLLKQLYKENNIPYVEIKSSDYFVRYEVCKMITDIFLKRKVTITELQQKADFFVEVLEDKEEEE